jgi:hypothetical protein
MISSREQLEKIEMSAIADGVFDCDTHIYEERDAVTRYLPEAYRDRAIRPVKNENDQDVVFAGDRLATFTSEEG